MEVKMRRLCVFFAVLSGCVDPDVRVPVMGPERVDGVRDVRWGAYGLPATECPPGPTLGVVTCSSLPIECQTPVPPDVEAGLHCLPEYGVQAPCFCVVADGQDSWCLLDGPTP